MEDKTSSLKTRESLYLDKHSVKNSQAKNCLKKKTTGLI